MILLNILIQLSSIKQVVYPSITNGWYVLSQKVNKLLNYNIHRPNFTSLWEKQNHGINEESTSIVKKK